MKTYSDDSVRSLVAQLSSDVVESGIGSVLMCSLLSHCTISILLVTKQINPEPPSLVEPSKPPHAALQDQ